MNWMTVGFEYAGELVQPETAIVRVPAALLDGKRVSYVNADGEQTELHVAFEGDEAVFALEFSAPAQIYISHNSISIQLRRIHASIGAEFKFLLDILQTALDNGHGIREDNKIHIKYHGRRRNI